MYDHSLSLINKKLKKQKYSPSMSIKELDNKSYYIQSQKAQSPKLFYFQN